MSNKDQYLDPRVRRTREMLRSSLLDLIPTRGFSPLTVRDITNRADINRATFYLHYRNKTDLLIDAFETLMADTMPAPPASYTSDPASASNAVLHVFEQLAEQSGFFRVMLNRENVPEFNEKLREYVEEVGLRWISMMQPEKEQMKVDPEIAIHYVGSAFMGVIGWWLENESRIPTENITEQLLHLTIFGLHRSLGIELEISPD